MVAATVLHDAHPAPTIAYALGLLIRRAGITRGFTWPGGLIGPLLAGLEDAGVRMESAADEFSAIAMASGDAWRRRELSLAVIISNVGDFNAMSALASARAEGHPLLVLSGATGSHDGRRAVQECRGSIDVARVMAGVCGFSWRVESAAEVFPQASAAIAHAIVRQEPARLEIPRNIQATRFEKGLPPLPDFAPPLPVLSPEAVERMLPLIEQHDRVVLYAGRGALSAGKQLADLAGLLQAPTLTSPGAKGLYPESAPLSAGHFSFASHALATKTLENATLAIVVGSGLGEFSSGYAGHFDRMSVIRIDRDPSALSLNCLPALGAQGDAGATMSALSSALRAKGRKRVVPQWFFDLK